MPIGFYDIIELQVWVYGFCFAIDINHIINDLQRVTGRAYATLYVVFASIYGAHYNIAKHILAVLHRAFAIVVAEGVVVWILHLRADGVARREVENHTIAFLHLVPTFEPFVLPLWFLNITLTAPREGMLHQWH